MKNKTNSAERLFQDVRTSSEEMTSQDVEKWPKWTQNGPKWASKVTKMDPNGPTWASSGHSGAHLGRLARRKVVK